MRCVLVASLVGCLVLCSFSQSASRGMSASRGVGGSIAELVWHPYSSLAIACSHQNANLGLISGSLGPKCLLFVGATPIPSAPDSADTSNTKKEGWLKRGGRIAGSVLLRIVLYLVLLAGLVMIPLGLGGTFVMVGAAALFGLLTGFEQISLTLLGVLLGLALMGEGIESLLGVAMARRYGASKWGMWGAFLGGIFGAIVGSPVPLVGNLVAALIGVFVGAFVLEWLGRGLSDSSLKAGWGALLGRAAASAIKLGLGMIILILVVARTIS